MARSSVFSLLLMQIFASLVVATRFAQLIVEETPYVPGYFAKETSAPRPTSPPIAVRELVGRDVATCGWMKSDGKPNTCGSSQYCLTTASGSMGIWNCCNPDSCYTQTACGYSKECSGSSPYCVTSYMSNDGTTYSRFMCGTTSSLVFMVYATTDLPQYTSSLAAASSASVAASKSAAAAKSQSTATQASSSRASAASAASEVASSSSAAPSSTSTGNGGGGGGMSGGAIAGAAVGAIGGIALLGGLAFLAWRRKNKNSSNKPQVAEVSGETAPGAEKTYYGYHAPEYHPDYGNQPHTPGQVHEMEAPPPEPQEMDASNASRR